MNDWKHGGFGELPVSFDGSDDLPDRALSVPRRGHLIKAIYPIVWDPLQRQFEILRLPSVVVASRRFIIPRVDEDEPALGANTLQFLLDTSRATGWKQVVSGDEDRRCPKETQCLQSFKRNELCLV